MQVELETGRTHQIRVHAAKLGWPVVGDRRYGNKDGEPERLHLHAWALDFAHPIGGERIQVTSQLPPWALAVDEENAR
jgi:23S rRNA-/tRNA-specific pseudouridylate synthase